MILRAQKLLWTLMNFNWILFCDKTGYADFYSTFLEIVNVTLNILIYISADLKLEKQ